MFPTVDVSSTFAVRSTTAELSAGLAIWEVRRRHRDRSCDKDAGPHDGYTGRYIWAESMLHSVNTFVRLMRFTAKLPEKNLSSEQIAGSVRLFVDYASNVPDERC